MVDDDITIRRTWRDALRTKVLAFNFVDGGETVGYRIVFWLWSVDVWFGNVPLMKSIIAANVLVWILFA